MTYYVVWNILDIGYCWQTISQELRMLFPAPACHCDCPRVRGDSYRVQGLKRKESKYLFLKSIWIQIFIMNIFTYLLWSSFNYVQLINTTPPPCIVYSLSVSVLSEQHYPPLALSQADLQAWCLCPSSLKAHHGHYSSLVIKRDNGYSASHFLSREF